MRHLISAFLAVLAASTTAAELKVATLHPLLGDLSRTIGGQRVEVIDLVTKHSDPHHFEPSPEELRSVGDADLFLASGMGLESYLPALRSNLPKGSRLVDIGDSLPSMEGGCDHPGHAHGHENHNHGLDPHWWHSIDAFRRATTATAESFADADPDNASFYRSRALAYREKLDALESWSRREIARIPRDRRILATAHDAFRYFCEDFGFEAIPVQGINREQMPDAKTLAALIASLRDENVPVIFPEKASNPKILASLTEDTGIGLAPPLIADGSTTDSYEEMVRHNVSTIVEALK